MDRKDNGLIETQIVIVNIIDADLCSFQVVFLTLPASPCPTQRNTQMVNVNIICRGFLVGGDRRLQDGYDYYPEPIIALVCAFAPPG